MVPPREVQHHGALGTHLRRCVRKRVEGEQEISRVFMVLQRQEPKLYNVKKAGSCVGDIDSQAAGRLGLLEQDRDSFSALRSEGTGLVL